MELPTRHADVLDTIAAASAKITAAAGGLRPHSRWRDGLLRVTVAVADAFVSARPAVAPYPSGN